MDMHKSAFYKAETRLTLKKEDLFRQGNLIRWEIPSEEIKKCDKNELLKNKDYAFSKMLIKVKNYFIHIIIIGNSTCTLTQTELWVLC
jgi:hypothetical protein